MPFISVSYLHFHCTVRQPLLCIFIPLCGERFCFQRLLRADAFYLVAFSIFIQVISVHSYCIVPQSVRFQVEKISSRQHGKSYLHLQRIRTD